MSVWVIIPVKPLHRAKSRLATVLSPEERSKLAEDLFRHVLGVVKNVPQVAGTLVISRDPKVLAIARDYGAHTVQESGAPELNSALMRATNVVATWRAAAVLVLPADLPFVNEEDVRSIIELGRMNMSMVIATDRNQDGTNAMLIRPPALIPYMYGTGSFKRHMESARAAGATVRVYASTRLMLDIDVPEDLERYTHIQRGDSENSFHLDAVTPDNAT